jgi:hypothetical protein
MSPVRSRGCQPIWGCRPAARTPVSKTGNVGAIPAALANSCREPASAGTCLQNRRSGCDPLAALQITVSVAKRPTRPAVNRLFTGSTPVAHPSPASTMAVQPPCKRSTRVRSLRWAPVRRARSMAGHDALNVGTGVRSPGPLPFWPVAQVGTAAFEAALCSDRARSRFPRPVV